MVDNSGLRSINLSKRVLSREELNNLFNMYYNGNSYAKDVIIESNLRLVASIVYKKFPSNGYDLDDLFQVGCMGLMDAVDGYKLDKNISFTTFAYRCIYNKIYTFMNNNRKKLESVSIENYFEEDDTKIFEPASDMNVINDYETREEYAIIRRLLDNLDINERNKEIIYMCFGFNGYKVHTHQEIADIFNMGRRNVSLTISKVLKKLTLALEEEYGISIEKKGNNSKKKAL